MAQSATATAAQHKWKFYRLGGLDQVSIETGDDLRFLETLDQKLWVALSCPTKGLELDVRTLELLDTDKDGRVRGPELFEAIKWCTARLRDLGDLVPGKDGLQLSAIDDGKAEGRALLGAARQILTKLGKADAAVVTAADVADTKDVFAGTLFNGDGIVTPESAGADEATRKVIDDALASMGGAPDRSGKMGVDQPRLDLFFADLAAFAEWSAQGAAPGVQPLGAQTSPAYDAVQAVRAKVDDYFNRVRLAAFDPRAGALLNRTEAELEALAAKDLSTPGDDVRGLPLAHVEAGSALPLGAGVNPAWAASLATLQRDAVAHVYGPDRKALTAADWEALKERLIPYDAWRGALKGKSVEKLGLPRVQELLTSAGKAAVEALLAKDQALEAEAAAIGDVVRMVHYRRDLHTLLRNFVSFADFYGKSTLAIFQQGTLYLDSRSCELCLRVDDPGSHAVLASLSRLYIAYCDCKRPGSDPMKIAACFTQGDSDYLMVGRNGVFYDRRGRDWDATITKIIDNPISIRQAFWSPYKKFLRFVEEQAMRFAQAKEKEADAKLAAAAAAGARLHAVPAPAVDVGKMVGIIAALGVGAGAIGTIFGGLVSGFFGLQPWWAKLVAVAGVVLAISGPSMVLAWLKLRQRTLGPVLDANGWAVNGRVRVNLPLGTALTDAKELPPNSSRSLDDPFEDKIARLRRRLVWAAIGVLIAGLLLARHFHYWPYAQQ